MQVSGLAATLAGQCNRQKIIITVIFIGRLLFEMRS